MIIQSTNVRQCIEKLIIKCLVYIELIQIENVLLLYCTLYTDIQTWMTWHAMVYIPSTIKSQINLALCFGADWAVRAVLKILANFARCFFQNKYICKMNTKFELSVHCRVRTKTLIIIKVRKKGQLLLENVLFGVKIQYNIWGSVYSQYL